jgi:TetR/AcrR family transcriptional regulator, regulator of cefoperazone and chloramphenicol sensitivity
MLLDAAGAVFAERGYRAATVREICRRARANVAAINYHFGDKAKLYRAVLRYAHGCSMARYPSGLGLGADATSEERLHAFVHAMLLRIFDQGRPAWHGKLMAREMAEPTDALDDLVEQAIRPNFQLLASIVGELNGDIPPRAIRRAACSIVGQCLFYFHAQPVLQRIGEEPPRSAAEVSAVAHHISEFSLAGLRAMGRRRRKALR